MFLLIIYKRNLFCLLLIFRFFEYLFFNKFLCICKNFVINLFHNPGNGIVTICKNEYCSLHSSVIYSFLTCENKNDPSATKLGLSAATGSMKLYDNAVSPAKREFKEQRIADRQGCES